MADKKQYYIETLRSVYEKEGRLPKKSDLDAADVNIIKGLFGPWRYALEAAGLIESKQEVRIAANREKRRAARLKNKN